MLSICDGGMPTIIDCTFTGNDNVSVAVSESRLVLNNCTFANNGEGIYSFKESNIVMTNCTFSDNYGYGIDGNNDSLTATNCTFKNNRISGMNVSDCNSTLTACTFERNSGGIWCVAGRLTMVDCTFIANSRRGGIDSSSTTLTLTKCRFMGNSALGAAGGMSVSGTDATLRQCSFEQNTTNWFGGGIYANFGGNLRLYDCTFSGNSARLDGGGLSSTIDTCLIATGCTFSGNSTEWINGGGGISASYAILSNCTFTGNWAKFGKGGAISHIIGSGTSPIMKLANCIVWNGKDSIGSWGSGSPEVTVSYSNVQGGWVGEGNIDIDPCFAESGYWADANDPNIIVELGEPNAVWIEGDYHLKSQAGRWDPTTQTWVKDNVTSPCIDAGNSDSPIGLEPFPNGGIINMGAYGGTAEASKSHFGEPVCETVVAGDINGDCKVDFTDFAIIASHWLLQGTDFVNKPPTVTITQPANGDVFDSGSVIAVRADAGDVDGSVVEVEFNMKTRTVNSSSSVHILDTHGTDGWTCSLNQFRDGNWTITAEATDDDGAMTVSPMVVITIRAPK